MKLALTMVVIHIAFLSKIWGKAMEKYNGWTNWDTWAVNLWLMNDEHNYNKLMNMSLYEVEAFTKKNMRDMFYYGDKITWSDVNMDEIIVSIKELIGEYK
jgi:hypothetical protein